MDEYNNHRLKDYQTIRSQYLESIILHPSLQNTTDIQVYECTWSTRKSNKLFYNLLFIPFQY